MMLLQLIVVRNHVIQVQLFYELFHSKIQINKIQKKMFFFCLLSIHDPVKYEVLRFHHEEDLQWNIKFFVR